MNPLLAKALGSILRQLLTGVGAYFVSKGFWTESDLTEYVGGIVAVLLSVGWSLYQKYIERGEFVKALQAPAGTPEDTVKDTPTPAVSTLMSKMALIFALAGSIMANACATVPHYQVARYGAEATKIGLQAQALVVEADKSGLQPNKELTAKSMVAFRDLGGALQKLAEGLRLYDSLTTANEKTAQAQKIQEMLREARRLTRVAILFTGQEGLGNQLIDMFDNLERLFDEILKGLAGNPTLKAEV